MNDKSFSRTNPLPVLQLERSPLLHVGFQALDAFQVGATLRNPSWLSCDIAVSQCAPCLLQLARLRRLTAALTPSRCRRHTAGGCRSPATRRRLMSWWHR